MRRRSWSILVLLIGLCALGTASGYCLVSAPGHGAQRALTVSNDEGEIARVPLNADHFAVSYRNSIYHTKAEERYTVQADGSYRLTQIAADQLAVLEEYYGVPDAPEVAEAADRREYVVAPDPSRPVAFERLSIAATDLGQRTLHITGQEPLELWKLVGNSDPYLVLEIKETQ